MGRLDVVSALAWLALSTWVYRVAEAMPGQEQVGTIGPGFFPKLLALMTAVFSISLIVGGLLQRVRSISDRLVGAGAAGGGPDPPTKGKRGRAPVPVAATLMNTPPVRVLAVVAMMSGYLWLMGVVGYRIATFVFIWAFMTFLGMRRASWLTVGSLLITLGIYCVFRLWLRVPLPQGSLIGWR